MGKRTLIVVPAFNEEKNITIVLEEIKRSLPGSDIIVINDCSTDDTSFEARKTEGAKVVDLPCNLGIGGAVQTGFKYALLGDYDYMVQVDGDGQHVAEEVSKLIAAVEGNECDMVIGSRFLDIKSFETSNIRRAGIKLFYLIYRVLIKQKVTDGTSGFRIYNRKCMKLLAENYPDDYPEPEAVILLNMSGLKICEVGVRMRERIHGKSSITPFKSLYYMTKVVLSIFFAYLRTRW